MQASLKCFIHQAAAVAPTWMRFPEPLSAYLRSGRSMREVASYAIAAMHARSLRKNGES
jgi:hypothetical protein